MPGDADGAEDEGFMEKGRRLRNESLGAIADEKIADGGEPRRRAEREIKTSNQGLPRRRGDITFQ